MAASLIGALRANLGLDSAQFESGSKRVKKHTSSMRSGFIGLARSLAAPIAAMASAAGAMALVGRGAADIDRLAKAARRAGGSFTGFRALEMVAGEAGVAVSTLADAVQSMDREIAKGGKVAADALAKLGLSASDLTGLDVDEKLALLSDRIKEFGLTAGQTSAVLQGLGIRNKEMLLAVQNGGDAFRTARQDIEDYGLGLTSIQTDKIEAANDAIGRLSLVGQYLGQQLSLSITPALGNMAKAMTDSLREGGLLRSAIDNLGIALRGLGVFAAALAATALPAMASATYGGIAAFAAATTGAGILTGALGLLRTAIALVGGPWGVLAALIVGSAAHSLLFRDNTDTVKTAIDAAKSSQAALNVALGTFYTTAAPSAGKVAIDLANNNYKLAESALAAAEAEIAKSVAAEKGMRSAVAGLGGTMTMEAEAKLSAAQAALVRDQMAAKKMLDEAKLARDRAAKSVTGAMSEGMAEANTATQNLTLTVDGLSAALKGGAGVGGGSGGGGGGGVSGALAEVKGGMNDFVETSNRGADAIGGIFAGMLDRTMSLRQGISGLIMEIAKMQMMQGFRGLLGDGGALGGIGSWIGGLIGANAAGTDHWRGGLTRVNERGGEIMDLPNGTRIIPHDVSNRMASSGGGAITFAPVIDARGADAGAVARMEAAMQRAQAEFEYKVIQTVNKAGTQGRLR